MAGASVQPSDDKRDDPPSHSPSQSADQSGSGDLDRAVAKARGEQIEYEYHWLIDPRWRSAQFWSGWVNFLLLFTAFWTPYDVAFLEPSVNVAFVVNRVIDVCFLVDTVRLFLGERVTLEGEPARAIVPAVAPALAPPRSPPVVA